MATAPSDPRPILGRVDERGRLVAADAELERLQVEAGSSLGSTLALPQLAAIARVVQRLQIPVSRRVLAAGSAEDVDMWVRAVPDGGEVLLTIEQWSARPAPPSRLAAAATVQHERLNAEPMSWSVDEHLRFSAVSPALAEHLSLDSGDVAGQPLTRLFKLQEDEEGAMPLLDALASRAAFSGQAVSLRSGEGRFVLDGEPTVGAGGAFAGFEGIASRAGSEAAPADVAKPEMDQAIRTALRSPLDNIVRSAEDMIDGSGSNVRAEYTAYAADIATAARHLLSVVRSLGAEGASAPNRVDLGKFASEAAALLDSAAKEREIAIGVQNADGFFANGDPRGITQILVNLIGNAVRHSPAGSAVSISFERRNGTALVHVADNGPGIAAEDQQRIFERFEQGSDAGQGSGLGLAIARRLARGMGGEIELRSRPGEGSRFTLALPVG